MGGLPVRVLLIEDDEDDFVLLRDLLRRVEAQRYELKWVRDCDHALEMMDSWPHDVCLVDYLLGGRSGLDLLREAKSKGFRGPFIFLTGQGDYQVDVQAMRAGAVEYLLKSEISAPVLERTIRYAVERKMAEETLRQSEMQYKKLSQKFDALLHAIRDTLVLFSPDLKVEWVNNAIAYQQDKSVENIVGRHCYELFQGSSPPCEDCVVRRCFKSGVEETQVSSRDGKFLDKRAFPIREGDKIGSVIVLISDITEKMSLQAESMRASHLTSLGELAAGVAHEINNPINGIINYAQILINECGPDSQENDIGKRIVKEGNRIAAITKSLLSFARGEAENKWPARIDAILRETLVLTHAQIRKEGIRLNVHLPDDLGEIKANFQQLQQVFLNIINNARYALNEKYPAGHDNKIIEIMGESVIRDAREQVLITFYDQGEGVPADKLSMLTKPFFSTKPFGKGTGLGLAIANKIVTDHGGRLTFESAEGKFTKVTVELPAAERCNEQDSCNRSALSS